MRTELGRTVKTRSKSKQILLHQLIIKPAENRHQSILRTIPAHIIRSRCTTQISQNTIHRKIHTGRIKIIRLITFKRHPEQSIQSMNILKSPLITQRIIPQSADRLTTSLNSPAAITIVIISLLQKTGIILTRKIKTLCQRQSRTHLQPPDQLQLSENSTIQPVSIPLIGNLRFSHRIIRRPNLIITAIFGINRNIGTELLNLPQPLSFQSLIGISQTDICSKLKNRADIPIQINTSGIPFQIVSFQHSILETHSKRGEIFQFCTTTPDRQFNVIGIGFLRQQFIPVCTVIPQNSPLLYTQSSLIGRIHFQRIHRSIHHHIPELVRIQNPEILYLRIEISKIPQIKLRLLTLHAPFSRNQNHPVCRPRTINSSCRSILQNIHRLDIIRINCNHIRLLNRNTINHIQRFICSLKRSRPPHPDFRRFPGLGRSH